MSSLSLLLFIRTPHGRSKNLPYVIVTTDDSTTDSLSPTGTVVRVPGTVHPVQNVHKDVPADIGCLFHNSSSFVRTEESKGPFRSLPVQTSLITPSLYKSNHEYQCKTPPPPRLS
eukprot:scaffold47864_cov48-Attheya_sp.AAC.1